MFCKSSNLFVTRYNIDTSQILSRRFKWPKTKRKQACTSTPNFILSRFVEWLLTFAWGEARCRYDNNRTLGVTLIKRGEIFQPSQSMWKQAWRHMSVGSAVRKYGRVRLRTYWYGVRYLELHHHVISLPCSLRKILCNPSEWAGTHSPPTNPRAPPLTGAPVFLSVNVEYKGQLSRMWRARRYKEGCGGGSMLGSGPESLCHSCYYVRTHVAMVTQP